MMMLGCLDCLHPVVNKVVGGKIVRNNFSGSVGVNVTAHVVTFVEHVFAKVVKSRSRKHVALPVDLPSDGSVLGANLVAFLWSGGGSGVLGNTRSHFSVNDHSTHEVGVEVVLVIDDDEDLSLDSNLCGSVHKEPSVAKDTVIERSLVLVDGTARSGSRMRPVNLVGLSNLHVGTVLPVVRSGELGVGLVVRIALESSLG